MYASKNEQKLYRYNLFTTIDKHDKEPSIIHQDPTQPIKVANGEDGHSSSTS